MNLSQIKELTDIAQSLVTILAIVVSGVWGYWLFVRNRQRYPRAKLTHAIAHRAIADAKVLLHVTVTVHNIGSILLSLVNAETRVQQVFPPPPELLDSIGKGLDPVPAGKTEVEYWPLLDAHVTSFDKGSYEIEPGESQDIQHDFVLDASTQTIVVYSYFKNETKRDREIGWDITTLYELEGDALPGTEERAP